MLGVHANTVRSWTDQGMLSCLRINNRGDRRYLRSELERFLAQAGDAANHSRTESESDADSVTRTLSRVAQAVAASEDVPSAVGAVADALCSERYYTGATLVGADGQTTRLVGRTISDRRLVDQVREARRPQIGRARQSDGSYRAGIPVADGSGKLDVMLLEGGAQSQTSDEPRLLAGVAAQLQMAGHVVERLGDARERERRADLMMMASAEFGSQLETSHVLGQLMDRTAELFDVDRAGIYSRAADGSTKVELERNLSHEFCQFIEHATHLPLTSRALDERRIVSAVDLPNDPVAIEMRPALVREGVNTVTIAPLVIGDVTLGVLALYHDEPYYWEEADLELLGRLAHQAATVMRIAQNYSQMATWAAQLQSIQQLGARLTRLQSVTEIGHAICAELNQLIDFHNVRVYRVEGDDCLPIAWRGEIGEYEDEDSEQLMLKVGQGITGWVARFGLAQNLGNAAGDRRTQTIPGTEDDLDESLLLAPMLYEDEVIGVIVLAKLGLNQFSGDDLRLLEIYASIAAQALANADATERVRAQSETLARQVNSQRELLRVTESILSTLDTQSLLEQIAGSLNSLVEVDNICVELHDPQTRTFRPIFARGVHADAYMNLTMADDEGVSGVVLRTGEAVLVQDTLADKRVIHFDSIGPLAGALIEAPLRSGERIQGLLTIERLGQDARFSDEEFELVKLFAAHVSIALRNAATHREVELRAETDHLTELWNHGALVEQTDELVEQRQRFAILMVDLDFFKRYNDKHGHQQGNMLLREVAASLRASCREADRVFRFGGDEFALVLPGTGLTGARTVAEKVQSAIAALTEATDVAPVTCSVGIAVFPNDAPDGPGVILAADRACYAAKRKGRNRIATAIEGLPLAAEFEPTRPNQPESLEPAYSVA
jgi:diguanylate cyclase (GGDEF)-like protein